MSDPLVSVVTIFLDEERFLGEAVESVLAQTRPRWELLLCDDGSTDGSTAIARHYARLHADRIRYLEHPGHENRGMSATRNLGLAHARGELIAFLDADDVWLPRKLELQVEALERHPWVPMVYGPSLYWHGWTGRPEDRALDGLSRLAGTPGEVVSGQTVLSRILAGRADAVCTCAILARTGPVRAVGGFEEAFKGLFEDQAFMAKFLIDHDVLVVGECTDRYRQHPESCCSVAERSAGMTGAARRGYLEWLRAHLEGRKADRGLRRTVARELALERIPGFHRFRERWRERTRSLKGRAISLSFALGRRLLPRGVREWLWSRRVGGGRNA